MGIKVYRYITTILLYVTSTIMVWGLTNTYTRTKVNPRYLITIDTIATTQKQLTTHKHLRLMYRVNETVCDTSYMKNKENINQLRILLHNVQHIDSITIYSFASPEGPSANNLQLSQQRGDEARRVIMKIAQDEGIRLDTKIILNTGGENWCDMPNILTEYSREKNIDQLISLINSDVTYEEKKTVFSDKDIHHFLINDIMPKLRSSEIVVHYPNIFETVKTQQQEEITIPPIFQPLHQDYYVTEKNHKHIDIALKTNMLYDVLMWTNYGIEVPFKINDQQLSLNYDHQFAWWRWGKYKYQYSNRYFQIGGEMRWWFSPRHNKKIERDNLVGHFVGPYFIGGKYEFQWERKWCYLGEFWSVGVTYGYAMPISKLFNIEFSVSVGYAPIAYRHFIPADDFSILFVDRSDMGTRHHIGVTKLGVSLVMPLRFKYKTARR